MNAKFGFYRPHDRAATAYTGELLNHVTGELYKPVPRTKQSFVVECDINNILKQYKRTGQIQHISAKAALGAYVDLPDPQDFQESLNIVLQAEDSFATLPAHIRARFGNDPAEFLGFMTNPANAKEIIALGLATERPASEPASPPAAPAKAPPEGGKPA